ncbi:YitT family protein [Kineothrix sp. MB12-C1]|uniref:YitT family protein n=1 Tax=Kineothrix sp. MB12-C1 TaxID=3070215 RepID=UPI0027D22893|nr:YitT family protein [Kineothrix sp. MB12-C1]WMC92654.1 YitT family protein [Kineothrix sp. MB12-C1]
MLEKKERYDRMKSASEIENVNHMNHNVIPANHNVTLTNHMEEKHIIEIEQEYEKRREEEKTVKQRVIDYIVITLASVVYAVGVSQFVDPNNLAPGGVTGVAIILNRVVPIETGTLILLINIPLVILGMWKFGVKFIISTFYAIAATSIFTNLLAPFGAATKDVFLASLTGSVLIAVSMGIIFKCGATTGGTDIIIKFLRLRYPHLKMGVLFFLTDVGIVVASAFVFQDIDSALYAGIAVVITSLMLDVVLYGRDGAKLIYIISDSSDKITTKLLEDLGIGVTHINGQGAYSGKEKQIIMCVSRKTLAPRIEEIVREEDADAFMIVTSATEIFGEGYKSYFSEKI